MGRLAWAGVALIAALAALGLFLTAATVALADLYGLPVAALIVAIPLAVLAAAGAYLALRESHVYEDQPREILASRLVRDIIRSQPLGALALFGALGFVMARRPEAAADVGRGMVRLLS